EAGYLSRQSKRLIIAGSSVQVRPPLLPPRSLGNIDDQACLREPRSVVPANQGHCLQRERHSDVAATDVRPKITLHCQACRRRNYITRKNRRNPPDRLTIKKFCPNCRTHREHRETR